MQFSLPRKLFQEFLTPYRNGMSHSLDHVFLITTDAEFWFSDKYHLFSQLLAIGNMLNFVKNFESCVFLLGLSSSVFYLVFYIELSLAMYDD